VYKIDTDRVCQANWGVAREPGPAVRG